MVLGFLTICPSCSDGGEGAGSEEWDFINATDILGHRLNPVASFNERSSVGQSQPKRQRAADGSYPVLAASIRNLGDALQVQDNDNDQTFEISARALELLTLTDTKFHEIISSFKGCVPQREREADARFADPVLVAHRRLGGQSGKTRKSAKQWKTAAEKEMVDMFAFILDVCTPEQHSRFAEEWGEGMTAKDVRKCVSDWSRRITRRIDH